MSGVKDLKEKIIRIRGNTKVTQIQVSRCVKMPRGGGDVFVSLTGNYGNSTDVDAGLTCQWDAAARADMKDYNLDDLSL